VQVHTGLGDSQLRLADSNPLLLEELLRTPEGRAATVVLIHGSYPWLEEQAYLAATKPNVHAELSLFNLFAPVTVADRLLRVVELAPVDRVLVGTDGHGEPETLWFAAHVLHEAWARAAGALRAAGARQGWIDQARELVFDGNARALYGF
jgi:predicted TIM-barrel fold metal-dependent hydrolase